MMDSSRKISGDEGIEKTKRMALKKFSSSSSSRHPLIVILGPTASGKTDFSIRLAHCLSASGLKPEIVNADSRQIYKFLDIGTAKITPADMEGVSHHLLSVLDPKEELTVAAYQRDAMRTIDEIHKRGGLPLLVGGSMLYISSIIDGLVPIPVADSALRGRLSRDYDRDGGMTLHQRLVEVDPESALGIPRQNKVYLIRALEIFESTGWPKSAQKFHAVCPYDVRMLGIDRGREELKRRIDARTRQMFASGWIGEVKNLKARGYTAADPGMKSHGYREIFEGLGLGLGLGLGTSVFIETISSHVRAYAKRQRTWWKHDPRIHWMTPA